MAEQGVVVELIESIQVNIADVGRCMDRIEARVTRIEDCIERIEIGQAAAMRIEARYIRHPGLVPGSIVARAYHLPGTSNDGCRHEAGMTGTVGTANAR